MAQSSNFFKTSAHSMILCALDTIVDTLKKLEISSKYRLDYRAVRFQCERSALSTSGLIACIHQRRLDMFLLSLSSYTISLSPSYSSVNSLFF